MKRIILASLIGLTSCLTPDQWKPEDHMRMMQKCRILCGKHRVKSYDPSTAECTCHRSIRETIVDD